MFTKCAFAAVLIAAVMQPGIALADASGEIATATDHDGYATTSLNIGAVHEHLHHAVNCLVGPGGRRAFDRGVENPCAKMGNGAICRCYRHRHQGQTAGRISDGRKRHCVQ